MKTEKLELKHLTPYFPYGLWIKLPNEEGMYSLSAMNTEQVFISEDEDENLIEDIKPFLRPLSALTKEIEHNGDKFVPCYEFGDDEIVNDLINTDVDLDMLPYNVIQKLIEWHFNVFNLPEELYIKKD